MTTATATKEIKEIIIDATLNTKGGLFNNDNEDKKDSSPIMTGSFDVGQERMPMSAFLETPKDKKPFLSLSCGNEGATHYYGRLFKVDEPSQNGPHYTGYLTVLPCTGVENEYSDEDWEQAPRLRVAGFRRRAASGGGYIMLNIMPQEVAEGELAF